MPAGLVLFFVTVVAWTIGSFVWARKRIERRVGSGHQYHVETLGKYSAVSGTVTCAVFVMLHWAARAPRLLDVAVGLALGACVGLVVGRSAVQRWETQLMRAGALLPKKERKIHPAIWPLFLALLIVVPFLPELPPSVMRHGIAFPLAVGGFFISLGISLWVWAKRKEHEGFSPPVITTIRNSG